MVTSNSSPLWVKEGDIMIPAARKDMSWSGIPFYTLPGDPYHTFETVLFFRIGFVELLVALFVIVMVIPIRLYVFYRRRGRPEERREPAPGLLGSLSAIPFGRQKHISYRQVDSSMAESVDSTVELENVVGHSYHDSGGVSQEGSDKSRLQDDVSEGRHQARIIVFFVTLFGMCLYFLGDTEFFLRVYSLFYKEMRNFPTLPERWNVCTGSNGYRYGKNDGNFQNIMPWKWQPIKIGTETVNKPPVWIITTKCPNGGWGRKEIPECKEKRRKEVEIRNQKIRAHNQNTEKGVLKEVKEPRFDGNYLVEACLDSYENQLKGDFHFINVDMLDVGSYVSETISNSKFLKRGLHPGSVPPFFEHIPCEQQADFLSLTLQYQYGGLYLDWDVLVVNSLKPYWKLTEYFQVVLTGISPIVSGKGTAYDEHGFQMMRPQSEFAQLTLTQMLYDYIATLIDYSGENFQKVRSALSKTRFSRSVSTSSIINGSISSRLRGLFTSSPSREDLIVWLQSLSAMEFGKIGLDYTILSNIQMMDTLSRFWLPGERNAALIAQNPCSIIRLSMGTQFTPGGFDYDLCQAHKKDPELYEKIANSVLSPFSRTLRALHTSASKFTFYDRTEKKTGEAICAPIDFEHCPILDLLEKVSKRNTVDEKSDFRSSDFAAGLPNPIGEAIEFAGEVSAGSWLWDENTISSELYYARYLPARDGEDRFTFPKKPRPLETKSPSNSKLQNMKRELCG